MVVRVRKLLRHQHGQDLVEYALIIAFVTLASAAVFFGDGPIIPSNRAQAYDTATSSAPYVAPTSSR